MSFTSNSAVYHAGEVRRGGWLSWYKTLPLLKLTDAWPRCRRSLLCCYAVFTLHAAVEMSAIHIHEIGSRWLNPTYITRANTYNHYTDISEARPMDYRLLDLTRK
jgi:hypothetical protein